MLLNGKFGVLTTSFGFVNASAKDASAAYLHWMNEVVLKQSTDHCEPSEIAGTIEDALMSLFPLESNVPSRSLLVPTKSDWTAYFDNGYRGTDTNASMPVLARTLRTQTMRVVTCPHTLPAKVFNSSRGSYGAVIWTVYGSDGETVRSVYSMNDGGKWEFGQLGEPFAFESPEMYRKRPVRDRFTHELLLQYLENFQIRLDDASFYMPPGKQPAFLVQRVGNSITSRTQYHFGDQEIQI